uniref:Uncharacterized protein n=1 Tax=viral metagenome TaxID=1070528 RepID=A0A6H1ZF43_9ZZZZ
MEQEDWDALKAQMDSPWGQMTLQCDDYELTLQQQTANKSWSTVVYVNGVFKGIWMDATKDGQPVHEEARRFFRKSSKSVYTRKEIELWRKTFGKREAAEKEALKVVLYDCRWKSFASLKKQLLAHNTIIKRIH